MRIFIQQNIDQVNLWVQETYNSSISKIDEIVSDVALTKLPKSRLPEIISSMSHRVLTFEDGYKKLYLNLRLLGGMITDEEKKLCTEIGLYNRDLSDAAIADNIIQRMPKGEFDCVQVGLLKEHSFPGEQDKKVARRIRVNVSKLWSVFNLVAVIGRSSQKVNATRAVHAIIGSGSEEDFKHFRNAYDTNYTFDIYVSLDQENFDFSTAPGRIVSVAYHVKGAVKDAAEKTVQSCIIL